MSGERDKKIYSGPCGGFETQNEQTQVFSVVILALAFITTCLLAVMFQIYLENLLEIQKCHIVT